MTSGNHDRRDEMMFEAFARRERDVRGGGWGEAVTTLLAIGIIALAAAALASFAP
jgi:hypothetical protein